jgi:hypothetical protein
MRAGGGGGEGRVVGGGNGGGGGSSSGRCAVTIPPILYIPPVISYRAPIFILYISLMWSELQRSAVYPILLFHYCIFVSFTTIMKTICCMTLSSWGYMKYSGPYALTGSPSLLLCPTHIHSSNIVWKKSLVFLNSHKLWFGVSSPRRIQWEEEVQEAVMPNEVMILGPRWSTFFCRFL